ncbi:MAG: putative lipid kinase BmrU [Saprospiraceae bacterium]|jgi:diacylglycerol kinase (ATP)|nr:putative lipid kinase BmrU [Saprospiraceae bacterium]
MRRQHLTKSAISLIFGLPMHPERFVFIINPNSGNRKHRRWESLIQRHFHPERYEILYTRYAGHSKSILSGYCDVAEHCFVAVGGDGTVSELLPAILRSKASLAIIPTGSGNGLARHLGISMRPEGALKKLASGLPHPLDVLQVGDHYCCNTCGLGFSAMVTRYFGLGGKRGLWNYVKLAFTLHPKSRSFGLTINGQRYEDVWSVEIANSSQLGNNAVVSPMASVNDGIMDVLIIRKPTFWQAPGLIFMVFSRNVLRSPLSKYLRETELDIRLDSSQHFHIDGEYRGEKNAVQVKIIPSAIRIIF